MRKRILVAAGVAVSAIALAACGSSASGPTKSGVMAKYLPNVPETVSPSLPSSATACSWYFGTLSGVEKQFNHGAPLQPTGPDIDILGLPPHLMRCFYVAPSGDPQLELTVDVRTASTDGAPVVGTGPNAIATAQLTDGVHSQPGVNTVGTMAVTQADKGWLANAAGGISGVAPCHTFTRACLAP